MNRRFLLYLLYQLITCNILLAQKNYSLQFVFSDSHNENLNSFKSDFSEKKFFKDTIQLLKEIESTRYQFLASGYLSAGIDSIVRDGMQTTAHMYLGEKYLWASIHKGNVQEDFLEGTGFRKKLFGDKPVRYNRLALFFERIIRNCEDRGYPFATVKFDSITITENKISATLNLERNQLVQIDSIIIKGDATVAPVYIYNYIGIKPGSLYKESQVRKISSRLKELPFIREAKPAQVLFGEKETKLFLFLENRKASQFDGILGLLPDETKSGKLNLTGEVHLKLLNALRHGEVIELNWKQLPGKTQDLKVHALYPFLFQTPFGIDGKLAIYKKDSTYIDVIKNVGVQYALSGNNYIKAFINDKETDLQSTKGLENITVLPPYADITTVSYGAMIHYEKLDYRLNPRKGFSTEVSGSTGNRTIRKNSDINPVLYDSIRLKSVTYQGEIIADFYFSPGGRHVINLGNQSGFIYNPELFVNELYRIGGLKSLRGFDEESIYASVYAIGKLEYRYLLEQNSFLFLFYNMAWYENTSRGVDLTDKPFGFGGGIDFETKIGIMSVSYALGKQFDNPIFLKNGKIHFGIVSYF